MIDMSTLVWPCSSPNAAGDAVEKYIRDLEALDELRDGERAELRN